MQVPKTPQNGGMWSFKDRCALLFKVGSNRSNYAKIKMEVSPDQDTLGFFTPDDLHLLEVVLDLVLRRDSISPDDPKVVLIARSLISAFQRGARDETTLLKTIGRWGSTHVSTGS